MSAATPASAHLLTEESDELWTQDVAGVKGTVAPSDRFGASLAFGDFDGDGRDDLAIGAYGETVDGQDFAGAVNVLYGTADGLSSADDQRWTQNSSGVADAAEADDQLGRALAAADFNGDGRDDLAIGAPEERIGTADGGAVHVLYGGPNGLQTAQPGDQLWSQGTSGFPGTNQPGDQLGHVLQAGDFNGDDLGDLAIGNAFEDIDGAEDAGSVVVLYGTRQGLSAANATALSDSTGRDPYDLFGASLAAGDFTGDGVDDLAIGVPGESDPEGAGAVTVWRGTTSGVSTAGPVVVDRSSFGSAPVQSDQFGDQVAAGDYNGDRIDDLAIGARGSDALLVGYGSVAGLTFDGADEFNESSPGLVAPPAGNWVESLATGEFDGDGTDDLAVTGTALDGSTVYAIVLHGTSEGLATKRSVLVPGPGERRSVARSAAAAGDVQGDGVDDFALGDPRADGDRGVVRVRYGARTRLCNGLAATVDLSLGQTPTDGDDVIVGTAGADVINAGAGNDVVCARGGADTVRGAAGRDHIFGGKGADVLRGGRGADIILGETGGDTIYANSGRDTVRGGRGRDAIEGGKGDDRLKGGGGRDRIEGNSGADIIGGNSAIDTLLGGKGNDTIKGGTRGDTINGNSGRDTLLGGKGDDTIRGGRGNDTIRGNSGTDDCRGGPGTDNIKGC